MAVKSAAKPPGAQPKSNSKPASASSLAPDVRPITNLTEQQNELREMVKGMAAEIAILRSMLPPGASTDPIDLTMVDAKTGMSEELSPSEYAAAMESVNEERLFQRYGTNDPDELTAMGVVEIPSD